MKNLDWNTVEMTIDFKPGFVPVMDAVPVDLGSGTNKYKIVVKQEGIVDYIQKPMVDALQAWVKDQAAEALTGDQRRERERALKILDEATKGSAFMDIFSVREIRAQILGGMEPDGVSKPSEEKIRDKDTGEEVGRYGLWSRWSGGVCPVADPYQLVDLQMDDLRYHYRVNAGDFDWRNELGIIAWRYHIDGVLTPKCPEHLRRPDLRKLRPDEIWTEWHGGVSPVPKNVLVNVVYRDGVESLKGVPAGDMRWSRHNNETDVIRWRRHVEKAVDPVPPDADGCQAGA